MRKLLLLSLIIASLLVVLLPNAASADTWASPDGYSDPNSRWDQEYYAYDNSLSTYTESSGGYYLEMLISPSIYCNKVRIYAFFDSSDFKLDVYYGGDWHNIYSSTLPGSTWKEITIGSTQIVSKARFKRTSGSTKICEFDFREVVVVAPTVTTQAVSSIEETTATGNGTITATGGINCTRRGFCYKVGTTGDPTTANFVAYNDGSFGTGAYTKGLTGLSPGTNYRVRAYAVNPIGTRYGTTVQILTKPAVPTNVQATDGVHTDKVVITWIKSTGATGYQVYRNGIALGWLGDVATYDDTGAGAPTITPGTASASDGTQTAHVLLSLAGESANNGATHTYKVRARNATGESADSGTNTGYRGVGALTRQWYRSAGDSNASYSVLSGATTDPYNDTTAPAPTITPGDADASDGTSVDHVSLSLSGQSANVGAGRYYKCYLTATGATPKYSTDNRGYRSVGALTYQWQRSADDSNANYSDISGATTASYNDTGAPADGSGRYYRCVENAAGAVQRISAVDRGYRFAPPTVTTLSVTDTTETTATLNGSITAIGVGNATVRGFEWDIDSGAPYANDWHESGSFGAGTFSHGLTSLVKEEVYYYRAYATNADGTSYGDEVIFKVLRLVAWYQPNTMISGTTLPDMSANNNHATITWGANPSTISVSHGSLTVLNLQQMTEEEEQGYLELFGEVPPEPGGFFEAESYTVLPGTEVISELATVGGIPLKLFWVPMLFMIAIVVGLIVYAKTRHIMAVAIGTCIMIGVFCGIGMLPWWVMVPYGLLAVTMVIMEKTYGF
ncbi:hypothetical protein ES703_11515 [subsurface metagenome]